MKDKMTEVYDNGNRRNNWLSRIEEEGKVFGGIVAFWFGVSHARIEEGQLRNPQGGYYK